MKTPIFCFLENVLLQLNGRDRQSQTMEKVLVQMLGQKPVEVKMVLMEEMEVQMMVLMEEMEVQMMVLM